MIILQDDAGADTTCSDLILPQTSKSSVGVSSQGGKSPQDNTRLVKIIKNIITTPIIILTVITITITIAIAIIIIAIIKIWIRGANGDEDVTSPEGSPGPPSICAHHQQVSC